VTSFRLCPFASNAFRDARWVALRLGPKTGFLAGFGGLAAWMPILESCRPKPQLWIVRRCPLSLAETAATACLIFISHRDWMLAILEILEKADVAGALSRRDVPCRRIRCWRWSAALWPANGPRRVACGSPPCGLFDEKDPPPDPWRNEATRCPA